jgi:hypothetical protein
MLSVPDHNSARGWLGRAKKDCLADQATAVADLEKEIVASEARVAEQSKKREESFKPKAAADSLVPGFVEAATKYRDQKKREKCDADPCAEVEPLGNLVMRKSTAKGARDAFRVFTRFTKERVTCDQLGNSRVIRRWEVENQVKFHCEITGGALSGLFALLEDEKSRPETYVVVFSDKWKERDAELKSALEATGAAPANSGGP